MTCFHTVYDAGASFAAAIESGRHIFGFEGDLEMHEVIAPYVHLFDSDVHSETDSGNEDNEAVNFPRLS